MKHRWLIFKFFLLTLLKWKPFVKINLVVGLSLGIKVWDILLYLLGEFDARASSLDFCGVMIFMVRDVLEAHLVTFSYVHIEIGVIMLKLESFYLAIGAIFSGFHRLLVDGVTNYP